MALVCCQWWWPLSIERSGGGVVVSVCGRLSSFVGLDGGRLVPLSIERGSGGLLSVFVAPILVRGS